MLGKYVILQHGNGIQSFEYSSFLLFLLLASNKKYGSKSDISTFNFEASFFKALSAGLESHW